MRIFLGILLIIVLGFTSCEGRISKTQALEKDIKEFQDSVSIQVDVYKPKNYLEREVDTTLSNGFRVKIKTYTDMDNNVLFTKIKDTINYQKYYRNFKFEILVEKSGKVIFKEQYDKQIINKLFRYDTVTKSNIEDYDFDKFGVLESINLVDNIPQPNIIEIDILYTIPETERVSLHKLFIDENGLYEFKRI